MMLTIVSGLIFIAVGLPIYAGFVKLAARFLGYNVSWKASFLFAIMMLPLVYADHLLAVNQPIPLRIAYTGGLLLLLVVLGSWFFKTRGTNRAGNVLGWGGGTRLIAFALAMMVVAAFAIAFSGQFLSSKYLRSKHSLEELSEGR